MGIGVLPPPILATPSQIRGYDKRLQMKDALLDIWEISSGMYVQDKKSIPDAIRMKVDEKALGESNNVTISWMGRLRGPGIYDPQQAIGREQTPSTKTTTIQRNIVRKVVVKPGYGPDDLDQNPYGLYTKWLDQLSLWNQEHHGMSIRQTVVETYGESLVWGRTAALCPRNWNPNIIIAGRTLRNMQVAFSANRATYTTRIVNSIFTSGGNSLVPTINQTLNQPNLSNAQNTALRMRISKLNLPGFPGGGWVMTMSELQAVYLSDPAWSARNLGNLYTAVNRLNEKVQNWSGVIGKYKNFLLVEDVMQPTLKISGTSDPWGMTAGYMLPGDDEDREREDPDTRDTFFILGKAAIIDWRAQAIRHIKQTDDYGIRLGHGTALTEGLTLPIYDQEFPGAGTHEQYGCILGVAGLPDYV